MTLDQQRAWEMIERAYNGRDSLGLQTLVDLIAAALAAARKEGGHDLETQEA